MAEEDRFDLDLDCSVVGVYMGEPLLPVDMERPIADTGSPNIFKLGVVVER